MPKSKKITLAGFAALGAGILFMLLGLLRQEHLTVLKKAVTVCLECIGIG